MSLTETIQIHATPEFRRQLESEAARLNLSVSAYILYLQARRIDAKARQMNSTP